MSIGLMIGTQGDLAEISPCLILSRLLGQVVLHELSEIGTREMMGFRNYLRHTVN